MRIVRAGLRAFVLPLVSPLETAHGAIAARAGFLVTREDEYGRFGVGEATPLPAFGGEHLDACGEALARALGGLVEGGQQADAGMRALVAEACGGAPCARAAIETALADLASQRMGVSLARWIRTRAGLTGEPAIHVRAQALVTGADPEAVDASARRARAAGFETFKLKLAVSPAQRDLARDLERVAALRTAIGRAGRIRLDANEAWSRLEAESALARLAPFGIEFIEQPVARRELDDLADLDRAGPIPIAADEALLGGQLEVCLSRRSARIFIVKPAVLGGIPATLELAARAEAAGIRIVFSNLIEGCVGRAAAVALAAGLAPANDVGGEFHGLGTAHLLARDFESTESTGPTASASPAVLHPHAGIGLGVSLGPCWALDGEVFGEGYRFESGGVSRRAEPPRSAPDERSASGSRWLGRFAPVHGDREALVFEQRAWSYTELARAARTAATRFAALGIGEGDLVAVLAPPSAEGVVLVHAMLERGIVLLPINARLAEPEIARALTATGAVALLVSEAIDPLLAHRVADAARCALIVFTPAREGPVPEFHSERSPRFDARANAPRAERAALVLLTSGTSGRPKAAVLTLENLIASAEASAQLLGSDRQDRWLLCMPLFHIAGLSILVRAALAGARVELESRFDARRVAEALDTRAISHVSLVATTFEQLIAARGDRRAPPSLRLVLLGGGPASESLLERAVALGYPIAPTYGLTEAASQVATRPPQTQRTATPGRAAGVDASDLAGGLVPLPGVEVRIVDASDRPVAAGVEGEIQVRGPIVMRGYLGDPEATAQALRGGWLATGDVGLLDDAGRLRVLDRRADLIVSGGENVYPAEVESVLVGHPDVVEAGVVGLSDQRFGARPLAFIVWRAGADRDVGALAAFCRARLAGYKVPVGFEALDELPRNASGKLLRGELRRRPPSPGV